MRDYQKENFEKLTSLINGDSINIYLYDNVLLENVYENKNIWLLLLYSGYLTVSKMIDYETFEITMVNKEIQNTIERTFLSSISEIDTISDLSDMFDLFLKDKIDEFREKLNRLTKLEEIFNDFRKEKDYRLYFSTLLVLLRHKFVKFQELESGVGRVELLFYTKNLSKGYLFELKKTDKEENIEKLHNEAEKQIDKKQYSLIF